MFREFPPTQPPRRIRRVRCSTPRGRVVSGGGILNISAVERRGTMSKRLCATLGLFVMFAACAVAQTNADRTIQVDINYTGSGTVNASHKIYVALWDSPDFSSGPPAAVKSLDSKKGTV